MFLVTKTVVYSKMIEASDEDEAIEVAEKLGWSDVDITEDTVEAEE